MERFASRPGGGGGGGMLGCSPRNSCPFSSPSCSSRSHSKSSDVVDFNDVFGGPPRRSLPPSEAAGASSSPRENGEEGIDEKPVFGGESFANHRRRYPSKDFFADIFRGEEYLSTSPRKVDRDRIYSAPGSRVLSPARPLPPRAEPSGNSLPPAHLSLPPKSAKGMDVSLFGSSKGSPYKSKEGPSSLTGLACSSFTTPRSRFSSKAVHGECEIKDEAISFCRQSPSSLEPSISHKDSSVVIRPDKTDADSKCKRDYGKSEVVADANQFHFSIYKWASKGVPFDRPIRGGRKFKTKEKGEIEVWSGFKSGAESFCAVNKSSAGLLNAKFEKQDGGSVPDDKLDARAGDGLEPSQTIEAFLATLEPESSISLEESAKEAPGDFSSCDARETMQSHPLPMMGLCEKADEVSPLDQIHEPVLKPLHSLFNGVNNELGNDAITAKLSGKGSMITSKQSAIFKSEQNAKKLDGENIISNSEANINIRQGLADNSKEKLGRNRLKGKVREFVKIFSQDASSKPRNNSYPRSQREVGNRASSGTRGMDEEKQSPIQGQKKASPNASVAIDEKYKQIENQHSSIMPKKRLSDIMHEPFGVENALEVEESFLENILILSEDQELQQIGKDHEEIKVSDAKIRMWSSGKEGNIRSLLSTLQYVLWPESGWKPVPLVDIIEGNAVKRAYQKALLCLHPDKLQQKGEASHHKYLAGKVFEILQEAWIQFNFIGSL